MTRAFPLVAAVAVAWAGCGGNSGAKTSPRKTGPLADAVPARANTAADALLHLLPAGADAIIEIDLARLRGNAVVGKVATALMTGDGAAGTLAMQGTSLTSLDHVVLVAYGLGTEARSTLTVVRGDGVRSWRKGHRLDDRTVALGTEALLTRVRGVKPGGASLAGDKGLLAVRTRAMPAKAKNASVRLSARLSFDARVALASTLGLDAVPTTVSVWGDVMDDLAVVGLFGTTGAKEAAKLTRAAARWRDQVARQANALKPGLGFVIRRTSVERRGRAARAILLIGPKRLARYASRFGAAEKE